MFKLTRWAAVSAAVLTAIAMLLYPGGTLLNPSSHGYSFFQNSLSDLGSTVAWGGQPNSRGAQFFMSGAAILALAGVGCFVALVRVYSSSRITRRLARTAGAAGWLSCAGLIGVSLTPADRNAALHGRCTLPALVLLAWISVMPWAPASELELAIPVTLQKIVAVAMLVIFSFQSYEAERVVAGVTANTRAQV